MTNTIHPPSNSQPEDGNEPTPHETANVRWNDGFTCPSWLAALALRLVTYIAIGVLALLALAVLVVAVVAVVAALVMLAGHGDQLVAFTQAVVSPIAALRR